MNSSAVRLQLDNAVMLPPSRWLDLLGDSTRSFTCRDETLVLNGEERRRYSNCVQFWRERFGDAPLALVHAPGRINLRGMHIDTHGGWLNLMTHQRGIVLAIGAHDNGRIEVYNQDPQHAPYICEGRDTPEPATGWAAYLLGGLNAFQETEPDRLGGGVRAVFSGNIPEGASLSSSAALCLGWLVGLGAVARYSWEATDLILAARRAEWHAGARTGTGDQAAIVLGRADTVVHTALLAEDFALDKTEWLPMPAHWHVLVLESGTSRQLSGAARVAYGRNRFAYSAALEMFRRALAHGGMEQSLVAACDRLSAIEPEKFGGPQAIWRMLKEVPEYAHLTRLQEMALPGLEDAYQGLFGELPLAERPQEFPIRAPLIYALAESARARQFREALRTGNMAEAGRAMCRGHDGDRVTAPTGEAWRPDYGDDVLEKLAELDTPLESTSGYYGASSPAMDRLCDVAIDAGAAGACLTGAGIAGAVLALCREDDVESVRQAVVTCLQSKAYERCANFNAPLTPDQAAAMVVEQRAVPGVGVLRPR